MFYQVDSKKEERIRKTVEHKTVHENMKKLCFYAVIVLHKSYQCEHRKQTNCGSHLET